MGRVKQDWAEKGWDETAEAAKRSAGGVRELRDLEPRRAVEALHRNMAEGLLAAVSSARAKTLVRKGVVSLGDFVVEDVGVSLDADVAAEETRQANLAERASREALRAEQ